MSTLELIIDFHLNSKRQGPGSEAETLKALAMTKLTGNRDLKLADLGCGTGGQTLTLSEKIDGQITAVDLFPEFFSKQLIQIDGHVWSGQTEVINIVGIDLRRNTDPFEIIAGCENHHCKDKYYVSQSRSQCHIL